MKIRSITLNNLRRFTTPTQVDGIGDGLNVLSEHNEHGKSTIFDAIQALFFKPHSSRDKDIISLRPYAGGAPEVTVGVETEAGHFTVSKRWLLKPMATVHANDTLIAQADEAESWIARLLGGDAGGPSGLIWVRQGMTELTGGTKKEQGAALDARRDLMTSVGSEVEAMTGGRRMDRALARCREELAGYATKTGRPFANGPWKAAQDRVDELQVRRDALANTAQELHEALAARQRARRDLRELNDPGTVEDRRQQVSAAQSAYAAAERHAEELESENRKTQMARLTAERAETRLTALRDALEERQKAELRCEEAAAVAKASQAALNAQHDVRATADSTFAKARQALKAAEAARTLAERARAARDGAGRRKELSDRIARAEAARSTMETAAVAARTGPDAKTLSRLDTLATAHATATAARAATATQVIAHYSDGRRGTIRAGDTTLADGEAFVLPRVTRLTLDGIGTLDVRPGDAQQDDDAVDNAAEQLARALKDAGADDLAAARRAAASRAEAERTQSEAKAVLASLAPDGIDRLREALAAIPVLDEQEQAPDIEAAEAMRDRAQRVHDTARTAFDSATDRLADLRAEAVRDETNLKSLKDQMDRIQDTLAKAGDASEDALASDAATAARVLADAEAALAQKSKDAPDLASTKATLSRAESVENRAREEIARLTPLLARLDERVERASGDAVEERLAETEEELEAAQATLARCRHEVAVLTRLEQALETARKEASDRYFQPIAKELKPLLNLLWPDAELTWGEDTLLPDSLTRNGVTEPIDILSGGTQEQVALLVRLAFARMLAHAGRIAPVILDDALVFTDDDRIERMFDALHRQAGDMQIIVLTCRQRAFRALGGKALRLSEIADRPEAG